MHQLCDALRNSVVGNLRDWHPIIMCQISAKMSQMIPPGAPQSSINCVSLAASLGDLAWTLGWKQKN